MCSNIPAILGLFIQESLQSPSISCVEEDPKWCSFPDVASWAKEKEIIAVLYSCTPEL